MHLHTKERLELIKGRLHKMPPAPGLAHQRFLQKIYLELEEEYRTNDQLEIFVAPFDVYFNEQTVVQPDVCICHIDQLYEKGCEGAPVLVVEIVSPSSKKKDEVEKRALYEEHRVKAYWLAYPDHQKIEKLDFGG
ncbi:MAG: Uma2 family endonuclease [Bacteroidota bacterium]